MLTLAIITVNKSTNNKESVTVPLIKSKPPAEFIQKRYRFDKSLSDEVNLYCNWASIKNENQFFEEAALYILKKDKDWQKVKDKVLKQEIHSNLP